jgi:hypothetical protein
MTKKEYIQQLCYDLFILIVVIGIMTGLLILSWGMWYAFIPLAILTVWMLYIYIGSFYDELKDYLIWRKLYR